MPSHPDWFFWVLPKLYGKLGEEAQELARRARAIKIPKQGASVTVAVGIAFRSSVSKPSVNQPKQISSTFSAPPLLSPRTANYVAALIRDADNFDYCNWLQQVREEKAQAKELRQANTEKDCV